MTNRFGGNIPGPYFLGEHPVRRLYIGSHNLWVADPLESTPLAVGSFTLSGYGIGPFVPELESGSFVYEGGEDTDFQFDLSVATAGGSFVVTGFDIDVDIVSVDLDMGAFALTGFEADFDHNVNQSLESGSYALTGFDISFEVPLDSGSFAYTGFDLGESGGGVPTADIVRMTQIDLEVLMKRASTVSMTQMYNEVLMKRAGSLNMTQIYLEVLMEV